MFPQFITALRTLKIKIVSGVFWGFVLQLMRLFQKDF